MRARGRGEGAALAVDGEADTWTFQFEAADYGDIVLTWNADHGIEDYGRPANAFIPASGELARYRVADDVPPTLVDIMPPEGGTVREIKRLRLLFDEPITTVLVLPFTGTGVG